MFTSPRVCFSTVLLTFAIGCGSTNASPDDTRPGQPRKPPDRQASTFTQARVIDIDFNRGDHGFVAGFADYPAGEESFYQLNAGLRPLPAPLDTNRRGFMLSGNNHSDDLLLFLQGPVQDLAEGGAYHAAMCVEFASDAPAGSFGVGGSPAESVYVKLGFLPKQAKVTTTGGGYRRVGIDVGSQAQGGSDAHVVGNVGVETDDCETGHWQIKQLCTKGASIHARSPDGNAWAWIGFDSGYEATTTVYVTKLTLTLQ
jgi:hypothetical protein